MKMAEYIEREAVVRYLKGYSEKECNSNSPYGMITSSVLNKAERALSEMPAADVQPISVIKELQEHIKQRILETAFNNGGIYGEVAEDIADRIDIWVDEFRRNKNG